MSGFLCRCCGKIHNEMPMHYGAAAPALWFTFPESERDLCGANCRRISASSTASTSSWSEI